MLHCTVYLPDNSEVVKFTVIHEQHGVREEKTYDTDLSVIVGLHTKLGFFLADLEEKYNER